jgi:glutamyl-tRNA reductase
VRTETAIGQSTTSVAFAAVQLARKLFGKFHHRTALVIGAGEMAEQVARYLIDGTVSPLLGANRSREHAVELLAALPPRPGGVIGLDELEDALVGADLVTTSTAASEPVLSTALVRAAMRRRKNRPLFIVDIAVPRDVEPGVGDLYNTYLYHIDDLKQVVRAGEARRRAEAAVAETIIKSEVCGFARWVEERAVVPAIATLRRRGHAVAQHEVERVLRRIGGKLDAGEEEAIRHLGDAIVAKLLHQPTVRLKEAAASGHAGGHVDALRYLFALDEDPEGRINGRLTQSAKAGSEDPCREHRDRRIS